MAISSPGVGSGLDVNSIVSQLVAIEKQPLQPLQAKATTFQTQLSLYGTIKSQVSALNDAANALTTTSQWSGQIASSSDSSSVGVAADATATSTAFNIQVTQLALAQTVASANKTIVNGTPSGLATASDNGTLTIDLGSWETGSFVSSGSQVNVAVNGADTLSAIASKINAANAGVTAVVLTSVGQERLVFQSKTTGKAAGFQVYSDSGFAALDTLNYSAASPKAGQMSLSQAPLDASADINGVTVTSATNTLTGVVPGLTLQLSKVTAAPVNITVEQDKAAVQKKIQALADAYSAVAKTLADATKYVSGGTSGPLQGDSTTVSLQSLMRKVIGSSSTGSTFSRLSEVGLEQQTDGSLKVNATKLTAAMGDMGNLQKLFTTNNSDNATNGFALKLRDFAKGLIAFDGRVTNKATALQGSITRNLDEQDRVNQHAAAVEKQLRQQYSALDAQMAKMSSLSSYVTAQLAQWNKTG